MAKLETIANVIGHYKYPITIVVGSLLVGFLSETSIMRLMQLNGVKADLEAEISRYRQQEADAAKELEALKDNRDAVEKVARERYFMKRDGEDVFVLSTDIPKIEESKGYGATK